MSVTVLERPWDRLREIVGSGDARQLEDFLHALGPSETARAISRLSQAEQNRLLTLLDPADAADVIEEVPEAQAAGLIEDLPPQRAAAIVDEMHSDLQADLLAELDEDDAEAILLEMSPQEARDVRALLTYPADTAGGLMITEYLLYGQDRRVSDVLEDLEANRDRYADYRLQYLYVHDGEGRLTGVLRLRDLLFADRSAPLGRIMIAGSLKVRVNASILELQQFFNEHVLYGVPVVDDRGKPVGVVMAKDVEEARRKNSVRQFLGFSGIVGGEEFRSMPVMLRSGRRLSWLSINIVLNVIAASVIAVYQDTLSAAIALAVFLPIISDMSGCSGNQAVAVSMRELALGLVRPQEVLHVFLKELGLGFLNGLALGSLLAAVALFWKGNPFLGMVVGVALALNTMVAVTLGGALPLLLKRWKVDPALVSGPILTTVTDMCGFFLVLSIATAMLPLVAGS